MVKGSGGVARQGKAGPPPGRPRLGMIVRADTRGLAYQTGEAWRHLHPDVTVAVDTTPITGNRFPHNFDQYPGAIISRWSGYQTRLTNQAVEALTGCDIVYTAETFYDPRLPAALKRSVLHVNPELYRGDQPTELWYPTTWRVDVLPTGQIMPVPIPDDKLATRPAGPGRILHVAGHAAAGDRNGTHLLRQLAGLRPDWPWRFTSQDGHRFPPKTAAHIELVGNVTDRWSLYDGAAILIMPRRYGGLCLPVLEAAARGLAVVMPGCPPNTDWPVVATGWAWGAVLRTAAGPIRMATTDLRDLEGTLVALSDRDILETFQQKALDWAHTQAWSRWEPVYRARLEELAS